MRSVFSSDSFTSVLVIISDGAIFFLKKIAPSEMLTGSWVGRPGEPQLKTNSFFFFFEKSSAWVEFFPVRKNLFSWENFFSRSEDFIFLAEASARKIKSDQLFGAACCGKKVEIEKNISVLPLSEISCRYSPWEKTLRILKRRFPKDGVFVFWSKKGHFFGVYFDPFLEVKIGHFQKVAILGFLGSCPL